MPRKTSNDLNTEPCSFCGEVMRYKADVPRHIKLHAEDKTDLFYHCPAEGCTYKALQKSNVNTHYNTHTGQKPHECPACPFATGDPGSLTRHRKKRHGYVPEKSAPRAKAKAVGTKASRRHSPYARATSRNSSSTDSLSPPSKAAEPFMDLSELLAPSPSFPIPAYGPFDPNCDTFQVSQETYFSWAWDKFPGIWSESSTLVSTHDQDVLLNSQQIPRHILPAVDSSHQLEKANTMMLNEPTIEWDYPGSFVSQFQDAPAAPAPAYATICPTDTYLNQAQISCGSQESFFIPPSPQTPEFDWMSTSQPCAIESLEAEINWDFISQSCSSPEYLSDSTSSFSSHSSPSSSISSPNYSFLDSLTSELSTLELSYPEPPFVY
ncbi:Zinc finger protein Pegasus [Hypsizygus marmoreus]|uniref:Zinc finger protein Pegasus n=1 Tax=Hypsizygus marmoreus TaxID=39966 RepID=A0A369K9E2_HYPMA|nr:Zinc finger protein Pegasus [Hypsizygus marmoreus]